MTRKSITVIPKKRGRPATGRDPLVALRLPPALTERIDEWAKANGEDSRSEAMRRLLERGLASEPDAGKPRRPKRGITGL
jgi:metal-responsive CopG/Arc/MetJ family transcriptional regulator